MIELLLQAERALSMGLVDQAERLYHQAADADPRNSIAVVGLARVALERADDAAALQLARRALRIDPENVAAIRLVARLEEVMAFRGEPLPAAEEPAAGAAPASASSVSSVSSASPTSSASLPSAVSSASSASSASTPTPAPHPPAARRSGLDRLLRRHRP